MTTPTTSTERIETMAKFKELLAKFDDAMLVSTDHSGQPHARPMRIAAFDDSALDDLWFITREASDKVDEILAQPRVAVTMADGARFLSISGVARIVRDSDRLEALWREAWSVWFPEGPRGSDVAMIQVRPLFAEYWDSSFPQGMRFAIQAAKAWLSNEPIHAPKGPAHHGQLNYV